MPIITKDDWANIEKIFLEIVLEKTEQICGAWKPDLPNNWQVRIFRDVYPIKIKVEITVGSLETGGKRKIDPTHDCVEKLNDEELVLIGALSTELLEKFSPYFITVRRWGLEHQDHGIQSLEIKPKNYSEFMNKQPQKTGN